MKGRPSGRSRLRHEYDSDQRAKLIGYGANRLLTPADARQIVDEHCKIREESEPQKNGLPMSRIIALVLLFALLFPTWAWACGRERWAVKTLTDPDWTRVAHTTTWTRISSLVALQPDSPTARECPIECTVYQVRATLLGYKAERDQDLHLVIQDQQTGDTMIAEIPHPSCGNRKYARLWATLRASLIAQLGGPGIGSSGPTVVIWGTGFEDRIHGQTGIAENGLELHPVLGLKF